MEESKHEKTEEEQEERGEVGVVRSHLRVTCRDFSCYRIYDNNFLENNRREQGKGVWEEEDS